VASFTVGTITLLSKKFSSCVSNEDKSRLCGVTARSKLTHRTTLMTFESAFKLFSRTSYVRKYGDQPARFGSSLICPLQEGSIVGKIMTNS
jgi:hypothetical protein